MQKWNGLYNSCVGVKPAVTQLEFFREGNQKQVRAGLVQNWNGLCAHLLLSACSQLKFANLLPRLNRFASATVSGTRLSKTPSSVTAGLTVLAASLILFLGRHESATFVPDMKGAVRATRASLDACRCAQPIPLMLLSKARWGNALKSREHFQAESSIWSFYFDHSCLLDKTSF